MSAHAERDHALAIGPSTSENLSSFSIEVRQLQMRWPDGQTLFDNLDLQLGAVPTGIVGDNGAGKSVLGRLMAGRLRPTSGRILRHGDVLHVPQTLRASPGQSIGDLAGLGPWFAALRRIHDGSVAAADFALIEGQWDLAARFDAALATSGLERVRADTDATCLSGGQQMRVALIGALLAPVTGLILDEPSNHLDAAARNWLDDALQQWRGGLVVISHDRSLLSRMQHIVELTTGGSRVYGGNYAHYRQQKSVAAAAAQARLAHARADRKRALRALREAANAKRRQATHRAADARQTNMPKAWLDLRAERAQFHAGRGKRRDDATRRALEAQVAAAAAAVDRDTVRALIAPGSAVPAGKRVLIIDDVRLPFAPSRSALDLTLSGPQRLAVTGPNGCGKTQLLKAIAGRLTPAKGQCRAEVPFAWLGQDAIASFGASTVLARLQTLRTPWPEGQLRSHLALLGLSAEQLSQPIARLSGGERLKAALACALWCGQPAQLLLLDEPTNHLDLASVEALEAALATFPGAVIAVSHDRTFLNALQPQQELQYADGDWQLKHQQ